jgi:hypothetical protein
VLLELSKFPKHRNHRLKGKMEPRDAMTPKISAAHAELQACEAVLAQKDQEVSERRTGAIRDGLSSRCRGMANCSWVWGETSREALAVLDGARAISDVDDGLFWNPVPDDSRPPSFALSETASQGRWSGTDSLANVPNQSLLQHTLQIPPAHSISKLELPASESSLAVQATDLPARQYNIVSPPPDSRCLAEPAESSNFTSPAKAD